MGGGCLVGCLIWGVLGLILAGPLIVANLFLEAGARRRGRSILAGSPATRAAIQGVISDLAHAEDNESREIVARLMDRLEKASPV